MTTSPTKSWRVRPFDRNCRSLKSHSLKQAGYATASIGKWHLGGKGCEAQRQGFDLSVAGDHTGTPLGYFAPYQRDGRFMPGLETAPAGEYLPDRLTAEAESFIEQDKDKPFFLYLPHYTTHIPMKAKAELIAKYRALPKPVSGQNNPVYAAMIESMDDSIGRLMRKLEQLGLSDDTVFIFTADNGGLATPEGPDTPATTNAPLRAIVTWPKRIKAGSVNRTPAYGADPFATAVELAGLKNTTSVDGLSSQLTARGGFKRDSLFWHYPHDSNQSINGGHLDQPGAAIRRGDYKLIELYQDDHVELYDLKRGLGEQNDLARSGERKRTSAFASQLPRPRAVLACPDPIPTKIDLSLSCQSCSITYSSPCHS